MWRTLSGESVGDIVESVVSLLQHDGLVIHIGTDSQHCGGFTNFATVIAVVDPGCGGRVFYRRTRHPRAPSLGHKLFLETELSVDAAQQLALSIAHDIVVHIDANEDLRHLSSRYVQGLAGLVIGHGFQVRVKPHSWCATHVADYLVKGKNGRAA